MLKSLFFTNFYNFGKSVFLNTMKICQNMWLILEGKMSSLINIEQFG